MPVSTQKLTALVGLDDYNVGMRTLSGTRESRHPDPVDGPRLQAGNQTGTI